MHLLQDLVWAKFQCMSTLTSWAFGAVHEAFFATTTGTGRGVPQNAVGYWRVRSSYTFAPKITPNGDFQTEKSVLSSERRVEFASSEHG